MLQGRMLGHMIIDALEHQNILHEIAEALNAIPEPVVAYTKPKLNVYEHPNDNWRNKSRKRYRK